MEEDYRAILEDLDVLDAMCDAYEEILEEERTQDWIAIDKTNMSCVFMNPQGEVRAIGAAYINNLFKQD